MDFSNPANLLIAGIYYIAVFVLSFFGIFSVYILVRYGNSRALSVGISLLFIVAFVQILTRSFATLQSL